jgi:serpin B
MRISKLRPTTLVFTLFVISSLTLTSCAQSRAQAQVAQSQVSRVIAPQVSLADLNELVAGNNAFAFDLYQALRARDGNLFYSPYSISVALAMTYAGARGETEQQIAGTLHYTLSQDRLHPAFNTLDLKLVGEKQDDFKLHVANSLWGQTGYVFLAEFLDALARNYGAGLRLLDFQKEPEPSRQTINDWVSEQTEDRIKDLIPQGAITPDTRLVLANAIYFDADWQHPFSKHSTQDAPFNTLDGEQVTLPMMGMDDPASLSYARGEGYQAVELPYQGGQMSMLILVPDAGRFEAFEAALDAGRVETILKQLQPQVVNLHMPKFSYTSDLDLANTLAALGMPLAFRPGEADFSGMDGSRDLFIGDVFHKAFVAVDEAGTEAAAATAVVMKLTAMPVFDVDLTVDRPFVFMIRDTETGAILFVGRVLNPKG